MCRIFNLAPDIVSRYLKFGESFNLLHAGVSYLRRWQSGFGVVGISTKYSTRTLARYPIFWGLSTIASLAYPDSINAQNQRLDVSVPSSPNYNTVGSCQAMRNFLRTRAQDWAQLENIPNADLFVFAGQWSKQTGIDLIADVFPAILEKHHTAQLICIGPIVDLYGKFAALKLENISRLYAGRVYCQPGLTVSPSCIYEGADFVLIPSRDKSDSLLKFDLGQKGALGIGARVGDSGSIPGWWFTVESTSSEHMISQFKRAIEAALASSVDTRAELRAQCAKQHISVSRWRNNISILHSNAIRLSQGTSQKACNIKSCNRSPMCSSKRLRFKILRCLKSRGGGLTGPAKSIIPTKSCNFTSKPTWPRLADTTTSTPDQGLDRGHSFRHSARSRDSFSEIDCLGTSGTTFWYVLIVLHYLNFITAVIPIEHSAEWFFTTFLRCMRCSVPVLVH